MRRDHRHHQRAIEQRGQLGEAVTGIVDQRVERGGQAIAPGPATRERAHPLALLGDVREVAVERVRARRGLEVGVAEHRDLGAESRAPAGELAAAQRHGLGSEQLAQCRARLAADGGDGVPQRIGQPVEIVDELRRVGHATVVLRISGGRGPRPPGAA